MVVGRRNSQKTVAVVTSTTPEQADPVIRKVNERREPAAPPAAELFGVMRQLVSRNVCLRFLAFR